MGIAQFDANKINTTDSIEASPVRQLYFAKTGKDITDAHSLDVALALSGLDYAVEKRPLYFNGSLTLDNGKKVPKMFKVPEMFATVRTDTLDTLGVVGKNYEILQNSEAFDFLDSMTMEAKYESAGFYGPRNAKTFITMSTEPMKILGDDFKPYILFTNSFDGSGCVRAMFTPVRVFCSNCIIRAIKKAVNKVSVRHCATMKEKLEVAREILLQNTNYMTELNKIAEKLATTPFSAEAFEELVRVMYPVDPDDREVIQIRNLEQIEALLNAYNQDDLQNFNNTAWKAVQAVSDFESHFQGFKKSKNDKMFVTVMNEMPIVNTIMDHMMALAA